MNVGVCHNRAHSWEKYQCRLGEDESRLFKQAIEKGNEQALARLGLLYLRGRGLETDFGEALPLLLLAEKKGSEIASVEIGNMYYYGKGQHLDYMAHFRRASLNGYLLGTIELGHCYNEAPGEGHLLTAGAFCAGTDLRRI